MIKCASETLATMFYRFGVSRNLSFVLPRRRKIYLGWPFQLEPGFYADSNTGYNILCDHAVYNASKFESLMPRDTVYISSLREPFSQVRSMFNYYELARVVGLEKGNDAFRAYFYDLEKYEALYKAADMYKSRFCVPNNFSMTRNLMAFNLGFPTGWDGATDLSDSPAAVTAWLEQLSAKFTLVIIVEYFDQSLVLLRRLLSWRWSDIIYWSTNVGKYGASSSSGTSRDVTGDDTWRLRNIYRHWSSVDHALYQHFNATLWRHIAQQLDDFSGEVDAFRQCLQLVRAFCEKVNDSGTSSRAASNSARYRLVVPESRWDAGFVVDGEHCRVLQTTHMDHVQMLQARHIEYTRLDRKPLPPKYTC